MTGAIQCLSGAARERHHCEFVRVTAPPSIRRRTASGPRILAHASRAKRTARAPREHASDDAFHATRPKSAYRLSGADDSAAHARKDGRPTHRVPRGDAAMNGRRSRAAGTRRRLRRRRAPHRESAPRSTETNVAEHASRVRHAPQRRRTTSPQSDEPRHHREATSRRDRRRGATTRDDNDHAHRRTPERPRPPYVQTGTRQVRHCRAGTT